MYQKPKVLSFLLIFTAVSLPEAYSEDAIPLKVFILAGQSNMVGQGRAAELPENLRRGPENVRVLGRNGRLMPMNMQGRLGPEVSFAQVIAEAWPDETVVLIKYARGGTSALAWSPEWSVEKAAITGNKRSGPLYNQLMKQVRTLKENHEAEIVGMLWAQGGRDARFAKAAQQYEQNLKTIINRVRKDLKQPDLPFILARTPDLPASRFPHVDEVRAAQEAVSRSLSQTKMILTDDLSQRKDDTHFDTEGQLEQGSRFAKAFLEVGGKKRNP